jgi:phosphosulfolactate phosphohydrolase-like enzyme
LGPPTYVITGNFEDRLDMNGADDLATAQLIERARLGEELDATRTAAFVADSDEAARTLSLGDGDAHRDDITYATRVDAFDFAMEVTRVGDRLRLEACQLRAMTA